MKTLLASILLAAAVTPAAAGPDYVAPSPRGSDLTASEGSSEIGPFDDVVFSHDSTALQPTSVAQIESAGRWLKAHPGHRIILDGYADSTGVASYNEDLAMRRTEIVRAQLLGQGVASDRIVLVVYGETGATAKVNPLDRRVVMWGTLEPVQAIVAASLGRKQALSAAWSEHQVRYTERRTNRPGESRRSRAIAQR